MRIVLGSLALALALAAPAAAQEPTPTPTPAPVITPAPTVTPAPAPAPPPEPTVQPGVSAGGVDLSGKTESEAIATLRTLRPALRRPVELRSSGVRMKLPTRKVEQNFDPAETARRAMAAEAGTNVKLAIEFIRTPIRTFVDAFAKKVLVVPRDAGVRITTTRIYRTKARAGRRLAVKRINALIERALADPVKKRTIRPKLVRTKPAVGAKDLKDRYPSIITIDRSSFTLRLFRRLKFSKSYPVAVGQAAYPTPTGLFAIQSKQVNPTWTAPNSPWAGESAGQSYDASDPNNPLKARWMGVNGSVGIHGTAQDYSIGTAASHGCIRMHVSDVIELYDRVAVGTPVQIS